MKKIQSLLKTKPDADRINLSFLQIESINDIIFELYHFDKLKEVDLSCNRLTSLPKDMSILRTVERLDLSSNLFEDVVAVFSALNTLPSLKELNLTYDTTRLKHAISYYMPKLEVINGEVIKAGGDALLKNPIVKVADGKVEIEKSKSSSSKRLLHNNFLLFDDEFVCIRTFFQQLVASNQENNANPKYQTKEFIEDNKRIDALVRQAHEYNEALMNKIESGEFTKNIECLNEKKKMIKDIVGAYIKALKNTAPKQVAIIEPLFKLLFIFTTNIEQQAATLNQLIGAREPSHEAQKSEVKEAPKDEHKRDNDTEKALLKMKLAEMDTEMHELRKENDDLYKFLVSNAKNDVLKFTKKMNKKYVQKPGDAEIAERKEVKESTPAKDVSMAKDGKDAGKKGFLAMKGYTLRQMNDLIYDIMENKKAYDARVGSKLVEPETLENFLYLYFKQKYGLKDLIMVEVASVVEKIKSFSEQSAEVDVFKRILKNELDEKFYWLLQSVKQSLKGKLETYYRVKIRKNASLVEINNFTTGKLNGQLEFEEAEYLLENSCDEKEFKTLRKKFRDYFDVHAKDKNAKRGLSYFDFLEFIFRSEIDKHISLLTHISQFFVKADEDKDGLISKKQFLGFMDVFVARNPKINIQEIMKDADPTNLNKISFSKVVEVLGSHFADDAKKVNLIQYLHTV